MERDVKQHPQVLTSPASGRPNWVAFVPLNRPHRSHRAKPAKILAGLKPSNTTLKKAVANYLEIYPTA